MEERRGYACYAFVGGTTVIQSSAFIHIEVVEQ
jgi:hypothetical protein